MTREEARASTGRYPRSPCSSPRTTPGARGTSTRSVSVSGTSRLRHRCRLHARAGRRSGSASPSPRPQRPWRAPVRARGQRCAALRCARLRCWRCWPSRRSAVGCVCSGSRRVWNPRCGRELGGGGRRGRGRLVSQCGWRWRTQTRNRIVRERENGLVSKRMRMRMMRGLGGWLVRGTQLLPRRGAGVRTGHIAVIHDC